MNKIYFWNEKAEFGEFSNFFRCDVEIDGKIWKTTEHYFAAMKTLDEGEQEMIRNAKTPFSAKQLGRRNVTLRSDWESVKFDFMLKALRHKFSAEPFKSKLVNTRDSEIYEDSPYDKVWGTGVKGAVGTGKNLLGKALMQVRKELINSKLS
jgi:ribA/ribD-fused uncharacterized protein